MPEQTPVPAVDPNAAPPAPAAVVVEPAKPAAPTPGSGNPPGWWQDRIDEMTRKNSALQRELEAEKAKQPVAPAATPPAPAAPARTVEPDRATIDARAMELMAVKEFNTACESVAAEGKKLFPETFEARITGMAQKLLDKNDQNSVIRYNTFLQAAIDTGEAAKILNELGGDVDKANQILRLPPTKMAIALAKMANELGDATPDLTQGGAGAGPRADAGGAALPKPVVPVGSRGRVHEEIDPSDPNRADKLSTDEWMKRRNAQAPLKRGSAQRRGATA